MANNVSFIYNKAVEKIVRGLIDFDDDIFKIALVSGAAQDTTLEKVNYDFFNDITQELATGNGYDDRRATTPSITLNGNNVEIDFTAVSWTQASLTASGAILYAHKGADDSANPVVAYLNFGNNVTSSDGTFTVSITSPLTIAN